MRSAIRPSLLAATLFMTATGALQAQLHPVTCCNKGPAIVYDISFPNTAHHEAEVKATFTALPPGAVNFRMARSSTGRYALTEYAKNVYAVKAVDGKGKTLAVTHPDPYSWTVTGHDGTVTLSYTNFASVGNGTFTGYHLTQEHIQPQGAFVYVKGLEARPIRVTFHRLDPSWTIATQLVPTSDPETFTAPGMQYLFDSPTHIGKITWREWTETHDGKKQTWRVALDDPTADKAIDAYADGARKIVHEAAAVFGEYPSYDYGTYTFVACYRSDCSGDGMEHRNSTSVTGGSMNGNGLAGLSTLSHEFFHSWNVKRIRPAGLEPFDYDRANMTDGLWIAEGFTQYYGPLLEERAGDLKAADFLRAVGGSINAVTNSPGRRYFGPVGMSQQAPFRDGASASDPVAPNTFLSYYTYGAGIAIALDLSLRARGKSLDDYMRTLWLRHGKPEIPYTMADARRALIITSGDSAWASDFWKRFVLSNELPDYAPLLERAGILLRKTAPGTAWAGGIVGRSQPRPGTPGDTTSARVLSSPAGTPLYQAGIEPGDVITTLDDKPVTFAEFNAGISAHRPGDRVTVGYLSPAGPRTATMTLVENPFVETVTFEQAGRTPTADQLAFRTKWLAPKAQQ
jgi:predicted metalloprotease with PDZ domain